MEGLILEGGGGGGKGGGGRGYNQAKKKCFKTTYTTVLINL